MFKRFSLSLIFFISCILINSACVLSESLGLVPSPTPTLTLEPVAELPPTHTPKPSPTYTPVIPTETPDTPPTPTPSRTPMPSATATRTATPTHTATKGPPTATFTPRPPTHTATRRPPTNTPTRRPPTATFTPKPPPTATFTPVPLLSLSIKWLNTGRPYDDNECGNFLNGTRIVGYIRRKDGTPVTGAARTAAMHQWIKGDSTGPFAYPGAYRDFPLHNNGQWDAEFPRRAQDFEWHIYISVHASDAPISEDLWAVSSANDKCGQPGTKNYFVADWIVN